VIGAIGLRYVLRPGDIGAVVSMHGLLYAREYGFDPTCEAYVAAPLAEFVMRGTPRERLWLAEHEGVVVGSIAIVAESEHVGQLRWFLVAPEARGNGLGKRLIQEAIAFSREARYGDVILWTISALHTAAHLYRSAGFQRVESRPGRRWGVDVVEEKYRLTLLP
jgi:GNAT superfamily N-acetyltransferase